MMLYKKAFAATLIAIGILVSTTALGADAFDPNPNPTTTTTIVPGSIQLIVPFAGTGGRFPSSPGDSPGDYIRLVFMYSIGLAALLAIAQLVFGAVQYTASAGFPALQEASKDRMKSAVTGLILLLGAITILLTFYRPGQRDIITIDPIVSSSGNSKRTEADEKYRATAEYQARFDGVMYDMREIWKDKWVSPNPVFGNSFLDPENLILFQHLVKKLQDIEDSPSYNWATNAAGRAGYLAARRKLFHEGIMNPDGTIYNAGKWNEAKTPGLYNAYRLALRPRSWAKLEKTDAPPPK